MKCSAATVSGIYKRGRGSSEPVRVREKHWLRGSDSGGAHDTTGGIQTHRNGTFSIVLDIIADQDLGRVGGSVGVCLGISIIQKPLQENFSFEFIYIYIYM